MANTPSTDLAREQIKQRIDTIEEAYEYFLAYAAQGVRDDAESKSGGMVRDFLRRAEEAVTGLAASYQALVRQDGLEPDDVYRDMVTVLEGDARNARAAIRLVRTQKAISSQLVDNLNASIHVRALLTDLFLIDEALKGA